MSNATAVFRDVTLQYFLDRIPAGAHVLDAGAGDGGVALPLADKGCTVDAIDMRPERIELLNRIKGDRPVTAIAGDFLEHPFQSAAYDAVISRQFMSVFEDNWREVVSRKATLCKPGGQIMFQIHARENSELCRDLAVSRRHRKSVERGYPNNAMASRAEIEVLCSKLNLSIEEVTPVAFSLPQTMLYRSCMSKTQREDYAANLEKWLDKPDVADFMRWLEREVIGTFPVALGAEAMYRLRK